MEHVTGLSTDNRHNIGLEHLDFSAYTDIHKYTAAAAPDPLIVAIAGITEGKFLHTCLGEFGRIVLFSVRNEQHCGND